MDMMFDRSESKKTGMFDLGIIKNNLAASDHEMNSVRKRLRSRNQDTDSESPTIYTNDESLEYEVTSMSDILDQRRRKIRCAKIGLISIITIIASLSLI